MAEGEKNDLDLLGKFIKATGKKERAEVPPYTVNNLKRLTELIRKEEDCLEEKRRLLDPQKAKGEIDRLQNLIDKYEEAVQKLLFNTVLRETDPDQASKTLKDANGDEIPPITLNQLEELHTLIREEIHKLEEKIGKLAICDGNAESLKDQQPTEQYELLYVPRLEPIPKDPNRLSLIYDYDHQAQKILARLESPCLNAHNIGQKRVMYKRGGVIRDRCYDPCYNKGFMYRSDWSYAINIPKRVDMIFLYPYPFHDTEDRSFEQDKQTIYHQYTGDILQVDYKSVKELPKKTYQQVVNAKFGLLESDGIDWEDYRKKGGNSRWIKIERTLIAIQFRVDIAIKNCLDCPQKVNPQNIDAKTAALRVGEEIDKLQKVIDKYEAAIQKLLLRE